jgi:hypothetical protein
MPRTYTPIAIAADATTVNVGKNTDIIVQRSEYNGTKQVSILRKRQFGGQDPFVESRANLNKDMFKAVLLAGLQQWPELLGEDSTTAVAAPAPEPRPQRGRKRLDANKG